MKSIGGKVMAKLVVLGAVVALAAPGAASAHHSFAMFNREEQIELTGVVKEFQWTNPHTWVQLEVPNGDGTVTEWSIESASPNGLRRNGWSRSTIQPGEELTVIVNPLHSGAPGGNFVRAVKADGTVLMRFQAPPSAAAGD